MLVDGGLESARPWAFNPAESQLKLLILNGKMVVARDGIEPPTLAFSGPRSTTELSGLSANFDCMSTR
jgi:hypothetical protein